MDDAKDAPNVLDTNGYNSKKNSDSSSTKVIIYQEESSISSNESGGESNEVYLLLLVCCKGKEHKGAIFWISSDLDGNGKQFNMIRHWSA